MFRAGLVFTVQDYVEILKGALNSEKITILENGLVPSANALFEENNYLFQPVNYSGHFRITNAELLWHKIDNDYNN